VSQAFMSITSGVVNLSTASSIMHIRGKDGSVAINVTLGPHLMSHLLDPKSVIVMSQVWQK
jgi:hypothetical protein